MDDLRPEIDLDAWSVEPLPDSFADDVLARLGEFDSAADDELDNELDRELSMMAAEIAADDDPLDDPLDVLPRLRPREHARPRLARWGWVAIATLAAAAAVLWLSRPGDRPQSASTSAPPVTSSSRAPANSEPARTGPEPARTGPEPALTGPEPARAGPEPARAGPESARAADLDRDSIRRAVTEQFVPKAKICYDELLTRAPGTEGRVTLRLWVVRRQDRGIVDHVEVAEDSDIADEAFRQCLVDAMFSVVFEPPAPDDRVQIVYPFLFRLPGSELSDEPGIVIGG